MRPLLLDLFTKIQTVLSGSSNVAKRSGDSDSNDLPDYNPYTVKVQHRDTQSSGRGVTTHISSTGVRSTSMESHGGLARGEWDQRPLVETSVRWERSFAHDLENRK